MEVEGIKHFETAIFENYFKENLFNVGDLITTSLAGLCKGC